jgi:hypothetical protein
VSKASEPWVCKLLDARKEEYLRQKRERQRSKGSKAQAIKELAIRVKGRKNTLPVGATFLPPTLTPLSRPTRLETPLPNAIGRTSASIRAGRPTPDSPTSVCSPLATFALPLRLSSSATGRAEKDAGGESSPSSTAGGGDAGGAAATGTGPWLPFSPRPAVKNEDVIKLQQDAAKFGQAENGMWARNWFDEETGLAPRISETIPKLLVIDGKKRYYQVLDGRTCKDKKELFNHKDKATKQKKPGKLFTTMDYSTFFKNSQVYELRREMPGRFDEIMAGKVKTADAWKEAREIVGKKKRVVDAMKGVGQKRKRVVVPKELVEFFVELCGAFGESVEKKDMATAAGRDALLNRVKASRATDA